MKRFLLIGLVLALVLILVGGAGVVYARALNLDNNVAVRVNTSQNGDRQVPYGYGPGGMMQGYGNGYGPGGMMQGYGNGYGPGGMMRGYGPGAMMGGRGFGDNDAEGPMHDYMISAFASAVGLTVDQVDTRLENGETLTQIANAQGFTGDQLTQLIKDVRQAAVNQAVAAGVITQAQADVMLEHMNNYAGPGFGPGFGPGDCPMWDDEQAQP